MQTPNPTGYRNRYIDRLGGRVSIPTRERHLFSTLARLVLVSTQSPNECVYQWLVSLKRRDQDENVTTHLRPVLESRKLSYVSTP
jgi:hypothetical protein